MIDYFPRITVLKKAVNVWRAQKEKKNRKIAAGVGSLGELLSRHHSVKLLLEFDFQG